jgi:Predicted membrane protein (DUF2306)
MQAAGFGTGLKWTGWALATLLAVAVGLVSLRVLTFNPLVIDEEIRPNLVQHPIPFYIHVILAPLALLIGTWQFLPSTRRSRYHRYAGRVYVACCLVSAVAGFMIALTTATGVATGLGFAILAVLWFGITLRGFFAASQHHFAQHRQWMIRSYALTFAAVTLRVILAIGLIMGFSFAQTYVFAAWACWIINLAVAEALIRLPKTQVSTAPSHPRLPRKSAA